MLGDVAFGLGTLTLGSSPPPPRQSLVDPAVRAPGRLAGSSDNATAHASRSRTYGQARRRAAAERGELPHFRG